MDYTLVVDDSNDNDDENESDDCDDDTPTEPSGSIYA